LFKNIKNKATKSLSLKELVIGLDVGGTHTDVVLLDKKGIIRQVKVPTDTSYLLESVWTGLERVIKDVRPSDIKRLVLSTTLTTNAIVENKLPPVGMIVSSGPGLNPEFFRTCKHYYNVSGSIDHRGREISSINEAQIEKIAQKLQSDEISNVGIVTKFSTRNPNQEKKIKKICENYFEYIVMGHSLSGNLNFPRRIATTYLNAAVFPVHKNFFEAVKNSLQKHGLNIPIYILKADAGTINFQTSLQSPGQTILSGPAASVIGSMPFVSKNKDSIVLDIGGTTTDIAVFVNKAPLLDPNGIEIKGYKTSIRSLLSHSIGLGGDSVIRTENGKLMIGPDRKGKALAFGGPEPTPTDALFVLGEKIGNGDLNASIKGFEKLAVTLDTTPQKAAQMAFNLTCKNILQSAREMVDIINSKPVYTVHEMFEGLEVKPTEILVSGGPAPYFASKLQSLSGMNVHVVPQWGVANAIGAALARTTCQVSVFADTQQGIVSAPEENFSKKINKNYNKHDAVELALKLLHEKAINRGASSEDIETEVIECSEFNMVRGFYSMGKNIRVKVQIKPGLIKNFQNFLICSE